jgi:hypothetical protein
MSLGVSAMWLSYLGSRVHTSTSHLCPPSGASGHSLSPDFTAGRPRDPQQTSRVPIETYSTSLTFAARVVRSYGFCRKP